MFGYWCFVMILVSHRPPESTSASFIISQFSRYYRWMVYLHDGLPFTFYCICLFEIAPIDALESTDLQLRHGSVVHIIWMTWYGFWGWTHCWTWNGRGTLCMVIAPDGQSKDHNITKSNSLITFSSVNYFFSPAGAITMQWVTLPYHVQHRVHPQ